MKGRFWGALFILAGFASPFVLKVIFPAFFYVLLPSLFCFYMGFLLLLRPSRENHKPLDSYFKWAIYAICIHFLFNIILSLYYNFNIGPPDGIVSKVGDILSLIVYPIGSIFGRLFPSPIVHKADGSVIVYISFFRSLSLTFLNLVFYALLGVFIKLMIEKVSISR